MKEKSQLNHTGSQPNEETSLLALGIMLMVRFNSSNVQFEKTLILRKTHWRSTEGE